MIRLARALDRWAGLITLLFMAAMIPVIFLLNTTVESKMRVDLMHFSLDQSKRFAERRHMKTISFYYKLTEDGPLLHYSETIHRGQDESQQEFCDRYDTLVASLMSQYRVCPPPGG